MPVFKYSKCWITLGLQSNIERLQPLTPLGYTSWEVLLLTILSFLLRSCFLNSAGSSAKGAARAPSSASDIRVGPARN